MSNYPSHKEFSRHAKEREEKYEWAKAADIYESAITDLIEIGDILKAGETQERAAYCRYRAAYQSKTSEEFKTLLGSTSEAYGRAVDIYKMLENPGRRARVNRVMEHFYRSWLIEEPVERKRQLESCVQEFKEALDASEKVEDNIRYGRVTNDFLQILFSLSELSFTYPESLEIIDTALKYGARALEALKKVSHTYELARCYYLLSLFLADRPMDIIESAEKRQELLQLGLNYAERSVLLSEEVGDSYLIGLSCGIHSYYLSEIKEDSQSAIKQAQKQVEIGEKIGDILLQARANECMAYYIGWEVVVEEDRDKINVKSRRAIHLANLAKAQYKKIQNPILLAFVANMRYRDLSQLETELEIKKKYALEQLQVLYSDYDYATESGSFLGQVGITYLLGNTLIYLAKLERNEGEKKKLLHEATKVMERCISSALESQPFRYWNIATTYNKLVDIKGQLAEFDNSTERKRELLLEAISDMEKSFDLFNTHISRTGLITSEHQNYASARVRFGEILFQMHQVSYDNKYLEMAVKQYDDVIEIYKKVDNVVNIAEVFWKKGWVFYQKLDYFKSASEFDIATKYYLRAGDKFPNHESFYADYSSYMEAWGNIARALDYHSRDEYFLEREYFEKAVDMLTSSDRWRYLGSNYQAWAKLAEAESQSRNDQCEKAITLFKAASELFSYAKNSIEEKFDSIGVKDESNMASELIIASDLRVDYCIGRIALEEAKLLDRKGERTASSRRYGEAAQRFHEIVEALQTEQERLEIRPLHSLCLAWQRKTQAEVEASSDLYMEASDLFEEARKYSTNEKTRLLTQGHSSFCRALSAGIQYEVSREERYHQELVRHIGSATDFYVRAGYDSALEYSRATQRLFEAYQYLDRARGSSDPGEGARYYGAAERLLRVSAEAFQRARHPDKRDEVVRLLRNLKEDRQIAISLSEILDTPGISSSTESFRMPTPSHEFPVGLEGFERADIQVKMFLPEETLTSGEEFSFELEFYNPGRSSASLVRVERLVPDDFEVSGVSGMYRFTDEGLDLRGKRIGPLSTVEVSLRARPHSRGEFRLEPRVMFVDDAGEQRFSVPEPSVINVREMGILSWLRGTRPSF